MRTEVEKRFLIKAIDAFRRRLIVISPDFRILAANRQANGLVGSDLIGRYCYELFYERTTPCLNCAANQVKQTRKSALHPKINDGLDLGLLPCLYAYPIISDDAIEAMAKKMVYFKSLFLVIFKSFQDNSVILLR